MLLFLTSSLLSFFGQMCICFFILFVYSVTGAGSGKGHLISVVAGGWGAPSKDARARHVNAFFILSFILYYACNLCRRRRIRRHLVVIPCRAPLLSNMHRQSLIRYAR